MGRCASTHILAVICLVVQLIFARRLAISAVRGVEFVLLLVLEMSPHTSRHIRGSVDGEHFLSLFNMLDNDHKPCDVRIEKSNQEQCGTGFLGLQSLLIAGTFLKNPSVRGMHTDRQTRTCKISKALLTTSFCILQKAFFIR